MDKNRVFGYVPSVIDGTEKIFGAPVDIKLPEEYSYRNFMAPIIDQGALSICVPCSVSAYLNWKENLKDGSSKDNKVALMDIYKSKTTAGEGMTFKDAFHYLRHHGVKADKQNLKIDSYGMVNNILSLKYALVMNGPCVGALRVYNSRPDFWVKYAGDYFLGGHAISIVGYDKEGFIIRNSWGTQFGDKGYTKIPYEEFGELMEVWTVIQ